MRLSELTRVSRDLGASKPLPGILQAAERVFRLLEGGGRFKEGASVRSSAVQVALDVSPLRAKLASLYFEPELGDPLMMGIFTSLVEDILRMANVPAKHPVALPYPAQEA